MSTNVQGLPHTTKRLPPRAPLAPRTKKASAPPPVDTTLPRGPDDLPAWRIVEQAWEVYEVGYTVAGVGVRRVWVYIGVYMQYCTRTPIRITALHTISHTVCARGACWQVLWCA